MGKNLFIGNLAYETDNHALQAFFEDAGYKVLRANVVTDRETGRSKGFGFVELELDGPIGAVLEALNGQSLAGRPLRIDEAHQRPPRRDSDRRPRSRN
ncbi:MAG: RNA-binding protein [Deltaproteobacteria bacterium]|nr:RNA-binding protein [Deltaproteobacteria bacterium]